MNMQDKPFSPACERNRVPILDVLRERFADCRHVLEIGSGTGQHAVHFAAAMPWLAWQCSDRVEYLPGIRAWLDEAALPNMLPPVPLDVGDRDWPNSTRDDGRFDGVFSANTLHIMGRDEVPSFFAGAGRILTRPSDGRAGGVLVLYGPFNDDGEFSSDSNRDFDASLKARDPRMGLRDLAAVDALAMDAGLRFVENIAMPANNRCLVWRADAV